MTRPLPLLCALLCVALAGGWGLARAEEPAAPEAPDEAEFAGDDEESPEAPTPSEAPPAALVPGRFLEAPAQLRARLSALAGAPPPGRPWRVAQLGDSHTESGLFTGPFSAALADGGVVSPGFVAPWGRGLHPAKITFSRGWGRSDWRKHVKGGVDGPSGTSAVATAPGARATLKLPPGMPGGTRLTAYWDATSVDRFTVTVGGAALREVDEPPPEGGALAQRTWTLPPGTREVELVVGEATRARPFRFCGFAVDRPDARVQLDGLGLGGSVHLHPLRGQRGALEAFLATREPDLVIAWYGTNSAPEKGLSPEAFGRQFEELLALVGRAAPGAAVVVLGLPDLGWRGSACRGARRRGAPGPAASHPAPMYLAPVRSATAAERRLERLRGATRPARPEPGGARRGRRQPPVVCSAEPEAPPLAPAQDDACYPATPPSVALLRDLERAAAVARGAAFFDLYGYMGEAGGMVRWYCQRPALAQPDLIHLSAAGYRHVASVLAEALRDAARPVSSAE